MDHYQYFSDNIQLANLEEGQLGNSNKPLYNNNEGFTEVTHKNEEKCENTPVFEVDMVKEPPHYNNHPSGIECIQITKHMNFCLGSAMKYIWRCDLKGNAIQDIDKAIEYLQIERKRRLENVKEN